MKLIEPLTITDSVFTASNLLENDHSEWDESTTYAAEDRVINTTTHMIYESVVGSNLGNDPTSDDGSNWIEVSATNKWKAFDQKIADKATYAGKLTYRIVPGSMVDAIAFFGLEAPEITVEINNTDSPPVEVFSETYSLVDDSEIIDFYSAYTTVLEGTSGEFLVYGFTALAGYEIDITVGDDTGNPSLGEIAVGRLVSLGDTLEGTEIGLRSFSTKEQDSFGNWNIVSRAKSDPINFQFAMNAGDAGRVKRKLNQHRDTPLVYLADESLVQDYGVMTYGFFREYSIPLVRNGVSIVDLEIEGLT